MQGSVSKSVKWLLTHRRTTRVTLSRTVGSLKLSRDTKERNEMNEPRWDDKNNGRYHSSSWLQTIKGLSIKIR